MVISWSPATVIGGRLGKPINHHHNNEDEDNDNNNKSIQKHKSAIIPDLAGFSIA